MWIVTILAAAGKTSTVTAMKPVTELCTTQYWVYDFKDVYMSLLEEYKTTRVKVFGNYEYTPKL